MKTRTILFTVMVNLITSALWGQISQLKRHSDKSVSQQSQDLKNEKIDQKGLFGFACDVNTLGYSLSSPQCGEIQVSFSSNETYEQVRVEWRESFTSSWTHRTFNGFSGNKTFTIPGIDPLKEYDIRMKGRRKDLCLWKLAGTTWHKRVKAIACNPINFTINDNSNSYCKPLNLTANTRLGQFNSPTKIKLKMFRNGVVVQMVEQIWTSPAAPPSTLNIESWAHSKQMYLLPGNTYKIELLGDSRYYTSSQQTFTVKRTRDCNEIDLDTPVNQQRRNIRTRF